MTHVVTQACIKCKYTDCIEICPVSCFYEGRNMVIIDPDVCIDCGVCVAECPIGAIKPEDSGHADMITMARKLSKVWPNITHAKRPLPDADTYKEEEDKWNKYFKEEEIDL